MMKKHKRLFKKCIGTAHVHTQGARDNLDATAVVGQVRYLPDNVVRALRGVEREGHHMHSVVELRYAANPCRPALIYHLGEEVETC